MDMVLTDDENLLRDTAKGFLETSAPIGQLRRLRDEAGTDGFDRDTWRAMVEMGWPGVLVPEVHGGAAMGHGAAGVIAEEMGRTLTASPWLSTAVMGATAIGQFGSTAQQDHWLPRIAAGEAIIAIAVDEGRSHLPECVSTAAEQSGEGFRLSGAKSFVADGHVADVLLVSARTAGNPDEPHGITLFLVSTQTTGVTVERQSMLDSRFSASVGLEGVQVAADAVVGEVDKGWGPLQSVLDAGRAGLAAEMSGSAQECLARTVDYLKTRRQFDRPIGAFQGLQHRAAQLFAEIEIGKSALIRALRTLDSSPGEAPVVVSLAKSKLGRVAQLAAQEAIQMHGGIGMTDEFDIGFFLKRVRVAEALYGDANYHTDRFARLRNY